MAHAAEIDWSNAPFEFQQLAEWLTDGKPELGWPGDPRLYSAIGLVTAANFGRDYHTGKYFRKGDTVGYRFEVWRHNEDGTDTQIITRASKDWHEIIPELNKMRMGGRGYEDTVIAVEDWNASVQKDRDTAVREAKAEMTEHLWRLVADRQNGRTTFRQVGGMRDEVKASAD